MAPVAVGAGVAVPTSTNPYRPVDIVITALCLVVALALQVGVNYANDYSDGIRGTDSDRVGPIRLVGGELMAPHRVRRAAFISFGVALVAGLLLIVISDVWWLAFVGAAAVAAAWYYTGGPRPYGYAGLGEIFVFVFFGVVAVAGTAVALVGHLTLLSVVVAVPVGLLASALLLVNNLRDIDTDAASGKRTLATRIGESRTRQLYLALIWLPFLIVIAVSLLGLVLPDWPAFAALAVVTVPLAAAPARAVRNGATGPRLVDVLGETARLELVFSLLLAIGLALSAGS